MLIDLRRQLLALQPGQLIVDVREAGANGLLILAGELPQRRVLFEYLFGPAIHQSQQAGVASLLRRKRVALDRQDDRFEAQVGKSFAQAAVFQPVFEQVVVLSRPLQAPVDRGEIVLVRMLPPLSRLRFGFPNEVTKGLFP
ncbi:hypothetical protein D3C78_1394690 [compost metagenome]